MYVSEGWRLDRAKGVARRHGKVLMVRVLGCSRSIIEAVVRGKKTV